VEISFSEPRYSAISIYLPTEYMKVYLNKRSRSRVCLHSVVEARKNILITALVGHPFLSGSVKTTENGNHFSNKRA
jgi:hypothetical protein